MNFKNVKWLNFGFWAVLLILFSIWMNNYWLLLGLLVLIDIFITKFIPWGAWKKSDNPKIQNMLNWIDDIVFALIAVYLINLFIFQNYQIPSSSLEKTLRVGDYLFVSKLSYGPRVPNTPISFPLVQNTLPVFNCKSYVEWPKWGYKRVKGLGTVQRNDIVVFNFPAGDTVALYMQNPDYYNLIKLNGYDEIHRNKAQYGDIVYRPVDKRENYVKRCVGMPGDSLKIVNNQIYINDKILNDAKNVQYNYLVETDGTRISEEVFNRLEVSVADRAVFAEPGMAYNNSYSNALQYLGFQPNSDGTFNLIYHFPLTQKALGIVKNLPYVKKVIIEPSGIYGAEFVYPIDYETDWTRDNYGPIWIPKKNVTITLDEKNIAIYRRCIENYENNKFEINGNQILINGEPATTYTFKYDYYWMMGDNRHCSADSRYWGFVPEDHIVGKPIMIWLSLDKDKGWFSGKIRFNRMFRRVESFN